MAIPSPTAQYDLNNSASYSGTGNTLYDLGVNGYDITLDYGPTYTTYTGYNTLLFTHTGGQTGTRNGSIGLGTTNPVFTFFNWIKPTALGPNSYNFFLQYGNESGSVGGAPGMLFQWNGSNSFAATFGSGKADINTATSVTLGDWVCFCSTCDGTTYKIYRNGVEVGSTSLSGSEIFPTEQLRINGLVNNTVLQCSFELNYLEIFNSALTAGQVTELYDNTVGRFAAPPAYVGRVGGRQFNQGFNG